MSFPVALFIYKNSFGIDDFFSLNYLAIYVILAIGARPAIINTPAF